MGPLSIEAPLVEGVRVPLAVWPPAGTASSPAPLLVFSHGFRQEPRAAAYLAARLAARGWVVAAPRHCDGRRWGADLPGIGWQERRCRELRAALDALLSPREPGGPIAPHRIALAGHSLGGLTCLALAGAVPGQEDPRVRAVVLLSTLLNLEAGAFLRVHIPTLMIYGERERGVRERSRLTMAECAEAAYANLPAPTWLLEVRGAGHYACTSRASAWPLPWLSHGSRAQLDLAGRLVTAFLERQLLGRDAELPDAGSLQRCSRVQSKAAGT